MFIVELSLRSPGCQFVSLVGCRVLRVCTADMFKNFGVRGLQCVLQRRLPASSVWPLSAGCGQTEGRDRKYSHASGDREKFEGSYHQNNAIRWLGVGTAAAVGAAVFWSWRSEVYAAEKAGPDDVRRDLPTFKNEELAKHKTKDKGIWVSYKHGVYDVTDFVKEHPGGNKILLAAGADIAPYWDLYGVHKEPNVVKMLEKYRIGNIETVFVTNKMDKDDPYKNDPKRNPLLVPASSKPFNAESPTPFLAEAFLTSNDLFFVRNHLPVPDLKTGEVEIGLDGSSKGKKFTLAELKKKFPKKSVVSVVQCAGNRRSDMLKIKEVKGLFWGAGAIGNAEWSGALLDDVLKASGIDLDKVQQKHLQFEGMDKGPDGSTYGASIPIEIAQSLKNEIIIAYEMNGMDIPRDHGYPLRVIIPGVVGARQVKWLRKITLSDNESGSHWQQRDYKGFNSSVDWHNVCFENAYAIQHLPVISAICEPTDDHDVEEDAEEINLRGYAWSGGGRGIIRVDVSVDGGKTWHEADLQPTNQPIYRTWAWTLWDVTIPLPETHGKRLDIVCKAVDISYNVQPDNVEGIWNLRGVLSNAWHRVSVNLHRSSSPPVTS
ncbi:sulfite oxidase-like [Gigantopelta aegis]|uniref:sulfite oxidase-like n=1 Tax=Gigantopelta aegis TaxID=1735272 RepID=UPI001B88B57E|nr:sulfite oxidase-like [Gigantopelta aegis]